MRYVTTGFRPSATILLVCLALGSFADAATNGSMNLTAGIDLGAAYSDNITMTRNPNEDHLGYVGAWGGLMKQSADYDFNAQAAGFVTQHADFDTEDVDDYLVSGDWRYRLNSALEATLGLSFADEHIHRAVPGFRLSDERDEVDNFVALGGLSRQINQFKYGISLTHRDMDFKDETLNGIQLSRNDEDRKENDIGLRFERTGLARYTPAVEVIYRHIDYNQQQDAFGLTLSSDIYIVQPGIIYSTDSGLTGDIAVGAYHREFDDDDFEDISSITGSAYLHRNLSQAQDVSLTLLRDFKEINLQNTPGYFANGAVLGSTCKTGPKGSLALSVAYFHFDFEDAGGDFDNTQLNASYTYQISTLAGLELKYTYLEQGANSSNLEPFEENRVDLSLRIGNSINPLKEREWFYWVGLDNTPN